MRVMASPTSPSKPSHDISCRRVMPIHGQYMSLRPINSSPYMSYHADWSCLAVPASSPLTSDHSLRMPPGRFVDVSDCPMLSLARLLIPDCSVPVSHIPALARLTEPDPHPSERYASDLSSLVASPASDSPMPVQCSPLPTTRVRVPSIHPQSHPTMHVLTAPFLSDYPRPH